MDFVAKVPCLPKAGETVLGGDFSTHHGGKGANQAVAAALAGAQVTFVARLGNDPVGEQMLAGFRQKGIILDFIVRDERQPSGVAIIMVDSAGENIIAVCSGANLNLSPEDVEAAASAISSADVLVCQLETPLPTVKRALTKAREAGACTLLNPAPAGPLAEAAQEWRALLSQVEVLTPNETEAEILTGLPVKSMNEAKKAGLRLLEAGARNVVFTLGSNGALLVNSAGSRHFPAMPVKPLDSTGAGDAFSGALAARLAAGSPLEEAVVFANAAAALSVTRMGAQESMHTREEVEKFLAGSDPS
jgi:ribokinase